MNQPRRIVQIAVPAPLRQCFDYIADAPVERLKAGIRVKVPFGRREVVGVVLDVPDDTAVDRGRLKPVTALLDTEPVLAPSMLRLVRWAAGYYHHPIGEAFQAALPVLLRRGSPPRAAGIDHWLLTPAGQAVETATLGRAVRQRRLLETLREHPEGAQVETLRAVSPEWRTAVTALVEKGYVHHELRDCLAPAAAQPEPSPTLNPEQATAVAAVVGAVGSFAALLVHGITGSGKTEVYLQAIDAVLARGQQALVLVPEIGLTPQLVNRFRRRFPVPVAVLHSGLSDAERLCAWVMARDGKAPLILGTRSAVFTPMANPGLIVVDEEHDGSYKQQDGFRYHARDLAVVRARDEGIPVVLGSATPSLESLRNAREGRFTYLHLPVRAGGAQLPAVHLLDMARLPVENGLSLPLVEAVRDRLGKKEQSLLFLNRRGFAPVLMCYGCGWVAACRRCDARLTLYRGANRLRCHHCGADQPAPLACPDCGGEDLHGIGEGTERLEAALSARFPDARILRLDRDTTRRKGALEDLLGRIRAGDADILVGTQMLSKGHHFPLVTLVGVLNADQGLYSSDFRAGEHLFQQVMQVAGRAGRGDKPGEVLIQTRHPKHPYFAALVQHDYGAFANYALEERADAGLPPYQYVVLLRAESPQTGAALDFLESARRESRAVADPAVTVMDPVPSPMERRAGRYRAQLLVQASQRGPLHRFMDRWLARLDPMRAARHVRWSVDVDPMDMY